MAGKAKVKADPPNVKRGVLHGGHGHAVFCVLFIFFHSMIILIFITSIVGFLV